MPYFLVDGKSIYDNLHQPKFHLLAFSDEQGDFQALKAELESEYAGLVDFNSIPLYPQVAGAFGAKTSFSVLLRPDNYIGSISTGPSLNSVKSYLEKVLGN